MSWKHIIKGTIICERCKKTEPRRAVLQRWCRECSDGEIRRRRREWQNTHPREPRDKREERSMARGKFIQERGEKISTERSQGQLLLPDRSISKKVIRIEFPYTGHVLKNAIANIVTVSGKPFVAVKRDVRQLREVIAMLVRAKLGISTWPTSKTWVDIVVQKPNNRCDAINVVDTLCDGLKVGLGVDDKWFAIGVLDWEIVMTNPMIFVQISTMADRGQKNCSVCGQIKYLDDGFRPHATTSDRYCGVCKECSTALSRSKNKKMNGSIPNIKPNPNAEGISI